MSFAEDQHPVGDLGRAGPGRSTFGARAGDASAGSCRGDQAMATQRSGKPPDEDGEDGPVCPVHAWSCVGTTEHRPTTSCRSTRSSTSLVEDVRPISMTRPSRRDTARSCRAPRTINHCWAAGDAGAPSRTHAFLIRALEDPDNDWLPFVDWASISRRRFHAALARGSPIVDTRARRMIHCGFVGTRRNAFCPHVDDAVDGERM